MTRTGLRLTTALLLATTTFTQLHAQDASGLSPEMVQNLSLDQLRSISQEQLAAAPPEVQQMVQARAAQLEAEAADAAAGQAEADAAAQAEADAAAQAEADAAAQAEADAAAAQEAEAAAQAEADAQAAAQAEADAAAQAAADAAAQAEADAAAKAEADAAAAQAAEQAQTDAAAQAAADAEAAKQAEADAAKAAADAAAANAPTATEEAAQELKETPVQELATPEAKPAEATAEQPAAAAPATAETPAAPAAETAPATVEAAPAQPVAEPTPEAAAAAAESPSIVIPDNVTADQQQQIQALEEKLRSEKKKNRKELIGAGLVGLGVGAVIGGVLGGEVVSDEGDRVVVEQNDGTYFLRKDENELLRRDGVVVTTEQLAQGRSRTIALRPNGVEIVTLRDEFGDIIRRTKRFPNGDEVVLIDNEAFEPYEYVDYDDTLAPLQLGIPLDQYVVEATTSNRKSLQQALADQPVEQVERAYSVREIRESNRLREKVRRVDLDAINFQTGSARVTLSQIEKLEAVGQAMAAIVENDPAEVFLVEGYTDAVGSDVNNLLLSDRRAETVAKILVSSYGVPPENLLTQGYGERYLKIETDGPSQANRRVTVRRITPLLQASR